MRRLLLRDVYCSEPLSRRLYSRRRRKKPLAVTNTTPEALNVQAEFLGLNVKEECHESSVRSRFVALMALMPAYGQDKEAHGSPPSHEANGRPGRQNDRRKDVRTSEYVSKSVGGGHARKTDGGCIKHMEEAIKPWAEGVDPAWPPLAIQGFFRSLFFRCSRGLALELIKLYV